jgi:hypothetical protein
VMMLLVCLIEVYSKYKDLERIAVKDLFVKYVPLD